MKICTVCGVDKPTADFYKSKISTTGFCPLCKECNGEAGRKYRLANKEKLSIKRAQHYIDNKDRIDAQNRQCRLNNIDGARQRELKYRIANKENIQARQKAYRQKNNTRLALNNAIYGREHKIEAAAYQLVYRVANRERLAVRMAAWQKKNQIKIKASQATRRARLAAATGSHTADDINTILGKQRGKCACCEVTIIGKSFDVDHKMPLKLGGSNDALNLQILCRSCNRSKGARHPVDFMQSRGFLL